MKEKILITGGSGFIGTNLVEYCLENQIDFRNFDKAQPIISEHNKYWIQGNLLDSISLNKAIENYKPNIVIHLAARADCDSNDIKDYNDNTEGTRNLVDIIINYNFIKKIIITSTQYVYKSKNIPFPPSDDIYNPHTTYGESKVITEQIVRDSNIEICWTIVRPTNVWGPWHMRYPNELWKMLAKGYYAHPGKKEVIRTYAYVKNVVYQIIGILNAPAEKINKKTFYVGDLPIDSYLWLNELSLSIRKKKIFRIPVIIFLFSAVIGSLLRKLGISFPLYKTRFDNMTENYFAPTNVTINEFGQYNSDLKNNVDETVTWLKSDAIKYFPFWKNYFKK